jgi:hypothetical protein
LDKYDRPWASIAVSPSGIPGFVTKSSDHELEMVLNIHPADPWCTALEVASARGQQKLSKPGLHPQLQTASPQLMAAIAIDFAERTRTKLAGSILGAEKLNNGQWKVYLEVTQAMGYNCQNRLQFIYTNLSNHS